MRLPPQLKLMMTNDGLIKVSFECATTVQDAGENIDEAVARALRYSKAELARTLRDLGGEEPAEG